MFPGNTYHIDECRTASFVEINLYVEMEDYDI